MQTIEIDKEVFENMVKSMRFLHTMVSRIWRQLHVQDEAGKWLTPYAAANILRITPRQLQTLKANGKLGYFQEAGGNCLFRTSYIEQFLSDNRMEADDCL